MAGERLLVPVSDSEGLRQTVEHAVSRALADGRGTIRFVVVEPSELTAGAEPPGTTRDPGVETAQDLLDRVSVWADEDAGDRSEELTVETSHIGLDRYLFSPEDVAEVLADEATTNDIDLLILNPEYDPGIGAPFLRPLEAELARLDLEIEEAPLARPARRRPLLLRSSPVQAGSLFFASFLFYQVLAGSLVAFDLVTGAVSATIVAVGLSRVTFHRDPGVESLLRVGRLAVYVPYLLWEIIKANVIVAAVILRPSLPIDPRMTRISPAVWGALPLTALANSITLTPGTLTVRVDGENLVVHTLVTGAREDLFEGGLERGVRFTFYGRKGMSIPSPRERGATEILQKPPSDEDGSSAENEPRQDDEPSTAGDVEETGDAGDER